MKTLPQPVMIAAPPLLAVLSLMGCSTSKTVAQTEQSGFLSDYSKLQPAQSPSGSPTLHWIRPDLEKGQYDTVYLEQPVLFLGKSQQPTGQVSTHNSRSSPGFLRGGSWPTG